ncbi:MAG: DUF4258 domain-containing protein [Elusimicrobiota bacterium]
MDIQVLRRKIVSANYELTHHAKEEAASDDLDTEDLESIILTGRIVKTMTKDARGPRFVAAGLTRDKQEAEIVCRILPSGRMRIITVYSR